VADSRDSITALAKGLKEGESASQSTRIPLASLNSKKITKSLATMRNRMNQVAARAKEANDQEYKVESGSFLTYDGSAVMLVATITCVADEGEDDI